MDVMGAIRERRAKAESKVSRAEKALETAKKELADVLAAERVMADITGESVATMIGEASVSARDIAIARLIPADPALSLGPAELHTRYASETGDDINLEAFRTAVWRLLKKVIRGEEKAWIVKSENGKYWREAIAPANTIEDENEEPNDLLN